VDSGADIGAHLVFGTITSAVFTIADLIDMARQRADGVALP
jgi:hypothetical protein